MKNDVPPGMPGAIPHVMPSHMSPQAAPVFDSCYVPVNVCNSNNMMGGYGLGGMYGMNGMSSMAGMSALPMNGMAMNGMTGMSPMNGYNGMGFSGYGSMPLVNMYG